MNKVKVYKFRKYDASRDKHTLAPRMATRQFIEMARGEIIANTEREIDGSLIDENGQAEIKIQPMS
jgi:hypothetical protein